MDVGLRGAPSGAATGAGPERGRRDAGGAVAAAVVLLLVLVVTAATAWLLLSALSAPTRPCRPAATAFAARAFAINRFGYGAAQAGLVRRRPGRAAGRRLRDDHRRAAAGGDSGDRRPGSDSRRRRALRGRADRGRPPAPAVRARRGRGAGPVRAAAGRAGAAPHRRPGPARRAVGLRRAGPGRRRGAADRCRGRVRRLPRAGRRDLAAGAGRAGAAVRDAGVVRLARPPRPAAPARRGRRAGWSSAGLLVALARPGAFPAAPGRGARLGPPGLGAGGRRGRRRRRRAAEPLAAPARGRPARHGGRRRGVARVRGSLLLVALPLGAVVLPATADRGRGRRRRSAAGRTLAAGRRGRSSVARDRGRARLDAHRRHRPRAGRRVAAQPRSRATPAAGCSPTCPASPSSSVDDAMWAAWCKAGYPAEQLAAAGGIGPAARVAVVRGAVRGRSGRGAARRAPPTGRRGAGHSTPVASFGDGADTIDRAAGASPTRTRSPPARREDAPAGSPPATRWPPTRGSGCRPRRPTCCAGPGRRPGAWPCWPPMTGQHSLPSSTSRSCPGEDAGAPRRLIAVTAIDGQPVAGRRSTTVTLLDQWLRAQQPPYRPAATELSQLEGSAVLLMRYDALGSTGLLPPVSGPKTLAGPAPTPHSPRRIPVTRSLRRTVRERRPAGRVGARRRAAGLVLGGSPAGAPRRRATSGWRTCRRTRRRSTST